MTQKLLQLRFFSLHAPARERGIFFHIGLVSNLIFLYTRCCSAYVAVCPVLRFPLSNEKTQEEISLTRSVSVRGCFSRCAIVFEGVGYKTLRNTRENTHFKVESFLDKFKQCTTSSMKLKFPQCSKKTLHIWVYLVWVTHKIFAQQKGANTGNRPYTMCSVHTETQITA